MRRFTKLLIREWIHSIKTKLALFISMLIGLISLFIFLFFPAKLQNQAIKAIVDKARSISEMTAFSISPALFFEDFETIEETFENARQNKDLVYIVVLNDSGRAVAVFNKDKADQANFLLAKNNNYISRDGTIYQIMTPIMNNGREIGELYLGFSLKELRAAIGRSRRSIALVSFMVFVIGIVAVFGVSTAITGPLSQMVKTVEQITKGDLSKRTAVHSRDELGHLARSFNLMVDNLESAQRELENANRSLEKQAKDLRQEIRERKRAEERTLRQSVVLEAINKVFRETLRCETDREVARTCLAVAEELTGSKFGFIGEVNQAGRFDAIALSDPGWDACKMPRSDAVKMIKDMEIRGIWSGVLKEEQSQMVNDPAHHPDRVGMPEGHPLLISFLGVPLKHAGKTIGMIGLANKESGYNLADQRDVETLSVAFVEALMRKRAEEALRRAKQELAEREKYLQAIFRDTPNAVVTLDAEHRIREWNPGAERLFGYKKKEAIGQDIDQLISHPEVVKEMEDLTQHVFSGKVIAPQDVVRYRKDGSPVHVTVAGSAVRVEGKIVGIVAVYTDITERKRAEEALHKERETLRSVLLSMADEVSVVDTDFTLLMVNEEKISKQGNSDLADFGLIGRKCYEVYERRQQVCPDCPIQEAFRTGKPVRGSIHTGFTNTGETYTAEVSAAPVREASGTIIAGVEVVRDITERRRLEQQLIQADRLASLGEVVSGVAHELNNPLASVLGFSQLLLSEDIGDSVRRDVEIIIQQAIRCQKIVQNLLTFARHHKPHKSYVNINDVIESMLELRAHELRMNNIEVIKDFDKELPKTVADYHQLQQVFFNLITNAEQAMVEYRHKGRLTVRTERRGNVIRVHIIDDGPGIPPKHLPKIFDPFFTTKEVGRGTGLGLSICYGIIQEHGGRIYAQSRVGKGATFIVELPIIEECLSDEKSSATYGKEKILTSKRILVVDDEDAIVEFVHRVLSKQGHRLEVAKNGRMAWEKMRRHSYDAILLDLKMPKMSGQALFKKIEQVSPQLSQRVIFMTGDIAGVGTQRLIDNSKNLCLCKPFTVEQLNEALLKIEGMDKR